MRVPLAALLMVSAMAAGCSPDAPAERDGQRDRAEVAAEAAPAPVAAAPAPPPAAVAKARPAALDPSRGVRRCGWLQNPTPGNWWLDDAQGQWVLGTQGADQAPGMDEMRDMTTAGWVETNGHYGYGCACMTITADSEGKVTQVADAQPKPLKQCRADRKLPKPD